jgi:hypothetical protein
LNRTKTGYSMFTKVYAKARELCSLLSGKLSRRPPKIETVEERANQAFSAINQGEAQFHEAVENLPPEGLPRLRYLIDSKIAKFGTVLSEEDSSVLKRLSWAQQKVSNYWKNERERRDGVALQAEQVGGEMARKPEKAHEEPKGKQKR